VGNVSEIAQALEEVSWRMGKAEAVVAAKVSATAVLVEQEAPHVAVEKVTVVLVGVGLITTQVLETEVVEVAATMVEMQA
jgi:hypothetical protein